MNGPMHSPLGRIDRVDREPLAALSRDVPPDQLQAEWPRFEGAFDSLLGRKMLGLMFGDREMYRLATARLDRDAGNSLGLEETVIPGGPYLRLRLRGEVPAVYDSIGHAFDDLLEYADHDPDRPLIEYYIHEGQIDCLVPIKA
jgi:hypothetical protein